MSVWLCIPSARPPEEAEKVLSKWRTQGYKIALLRDAGEGIACDYLHSALTYPGYAQAVNSLVRDVIELDPHAEWFVTGGDDVEPDMNNTAEEIARQTAAYFVARELTRGGEPGFRFPTPQACATFGVMQPTGDRFAGGSIDRICGSPWMGREFCKRVNGGRGPLWPEYTHMFVDEELQHVAQRLGIFQQRPDLIHLHNHFMRESGAVDSRAVTAAIPEHLREVNSREHWDKYQALFNARKAAGFPGHEPLSNCEAA